MRGDKVESKQRLGSIWAACSIFGVAIGMIVAYLTGSQFWIGIGAMLGAGTAFMATAIVRR